MLSRLKYNSTAIAAEEKTFVPSVESELPPPNPSVPLPQLRFFYLQTEVLNWVKNPKVLDERLKAIYNISEKTENVYVTTLLFPNYQAEIELKLTEHANETIIELTARSGEPFHLQLKYAKENQSLTTTGIIIAKSALCADLCYFIYQFFKPLTHNFENDPVYAKKGNHFEYDEFVKLLNAFQHRSAISLMGFLRLNSLELDDGCYFWVDYPKHLKNTDSPDENDCFQIKIFSDKYVSNICHESQFMPEKYVGQFLYDYIHVFDYKELVATPETETQQKPILAIRSGLNNIGEMFEIRNSAQLSGKEILNFFDLFKYLCETYYLHDQSEINGARTHLIRALAGKQSIYASIKFRPANLAKLLLHDRKEFFSQSEAKYKKAIATASALPASLLMVFVEPNDNDKFSKLIAKYSGDVKDPAIRHIAQAILAQSKTSNDTSDMKLFFELLIQSLETTSRKSIPTNARKLSRVIAMIENTRFFVRHRTMPELELEAQASTEADLPQAPPLAESKTAALNTSTAMIAFNLFSETAAKRGIEFKIPSWETRSPVELEIIGNNIMHLLDKLPPTPAKTSMPVPMSKKRHRPQKILGKQLTQKRVKSAEIKRKSREKLLAGFNELKNLLRRLGVFKGVNEPTEQQILESAIDVIRLQKERLDLLQRHRQIKNR